MLFGLGLFVLVGLSWTSLQAVHSPLLDSDQSIWILLARKPHFPDALYFYGQNRLGSLLPLIAHILVRIGFSAIWAIAIVNVLFQLGASIFIYRISKSMPVALLMASVLLLPPWTMYVLNLIGHPYTSQFLLWGILLWRLKRLKKFNPKEAIVLSSLSLMSFWVSDLSILFIPFVAYHLWKNNKPFERRPWIILSISFTLGFLAILFIKNQLPGPRGYFLKFANKEEVVQNFQGLLDLFKYYWHQGFHYGIFLLLGVLIFLITPFFSKTTQESKLNLSFGLLALVFTLLSKWVALNGGEARYFAFPFVLLLFGVFLREGRFVKWSSWVVLILFFSAGLETKEKLSPQYRATPDRPSREEMAALSTKLDGAVIGDYWSIYLLQVFNPSLQVSGEYWPVRDHWNREAVLRSDTFWFVNLALEERVLLEGDSLQAIGPILYEGQSSARQYIRK